MPVFAHIASSRHEQCMDAGMDGVITKSVNRERLIGSISDALNGAPSARRGTGCGMMVVTLRHNEEILAIGT